MIKSDHKTFVMTIHHIDECPECGSKNTNHRKVRISDSLDRAIVTCNDCGEEWDGSLQILDQKSKKALDQYDFS